jgi:spore germination protein KB
MVEKQTISASQFIHLTVLFIIGSSTLIAPPLVVADAKQDAWISVLIAFIIGLLLVLLYSVIARRYPDLTLVEYSKVILGKWPGTVFSLLYVLYFLLLTADLLRIVGDFLTTVVMPETPIQAIETLFILTVIWGVRLGLEAFSRTAEILMPWILIFFMLLVLLLIPEMKVHHITPLLENGIHPVLRGAWPLLGVPFLDLIVFLMIAPNVKKSASIFRHLTLGVTIGGFLLFLITILSILVLGPDYIVRLNYPVFELAQKIDIGLFIQRIEILAGGIIFVSIFIKITICYYATAMSLAQTLRLQHYRSLTLPLGMLIVALSLLISPNNVFFRVFTLQVWTPLCILYGFLLPLLLLIVDTARGNGKRTSESRNKDG